MTHSTLLTDLIAWSAQVACIVAIGGLLPTLLRLEAPGVRYGYFRALLALCLAVAPEPADGRRQCQHRNVRTHAHRCSNGGGRDHDGAELSVDRRIGRMHCPGYRGPWRLDSDRAGASRASEDGGLCIALVRRAR